MTRPVNLQVFGVRNFAMKKTGDNDDNYDDSGGMLEDLESMPEPVVDFFDETYGDDLDALSDIYDAKLGRIDKDYMEEDREQAQTALKTMKAEMTDADKVLSEQWVLNPENDVYFNPTTGETKVPYEKSMSEFKKRRATRTREEWVEQQNKEGFPDFMSPVDVQPTTQLYMENEMDVVRRKYNFLDFKRLGQELDKADSRFFQAPTTPNMIRWGPDVEEADGAMFQDSWDIESLKFLGQLPIKYHIATMRCVHGTSVGRKHSYGSLVIGGNGKGWGGFGYGKGLTPDAATRRAAHELRKNLMDVSLEENRTIPRSTVGKHGRTKVIMKRCVRGHGVVAGPIMGAICESLGIHDISTKIVGSSKKNPLHVVYAAYKGFAKQIAPRQLAMDRGANFYKTFDAATREPPPTREALERRTKTIRDFISLASAEWRRRPDMALRFSDEAIAAEEAAVWAEWAANGDDDDDSDSDGKNAKKAASVAAAVEA